MAIPGSRTVTNKGFIRPGSGDLGSTFFTDMDTNISQIDTHTHNGADSSGLAKTQTLAVAGGGTSSTGTNTAWADDGTGAGTYSMTVTTPLLTIANTANTRNINVDEVVIQLRNSSGEIVSNRVVRQSSSTWKVYTIDNTQVLTAYYI